jgi:hypothetical protein
VAATVGLGAVVVRVWPEPSGNGEVQAASSAETTDPTDGASVEGLPLRMGLAVEGASVSSAVDAATPNDPPPTEPLGINQQWANADKSRSIGVFALSRAELAELSEGMVHQGSPAPTEPVDLGDGLVGQLTDLGTAIGPMGWGQQYQVRIELPDAIVHVSSFGVTKDEVVAALPSLEVGAEATSIAMPDVPVDLGEVGPYDMVISQGAHTFVNYVFADGASAAVEVYAHPEQMVLDDIERAKANPTADEYVIDVRGNDAIVRAGISTTHTVSWQEDSGELVVVLLTQASGPAVPDVSVVVDGITPLDEAAFQDLVARFPG